MTSDPLKDIGEGLGKGATEGLLDYTENKIKELINSFNEKKLKFIGDKRTIEVAKEIKNSGELSFYKFYIKDKEMLFQIKLGLALRKIEGDSERRKNLREKVIKKYGVKGLHIAYFVQNGILNRYVAILLDNLDSTTRLEETIVKTLENIEKHAIFVDYRYDLRQLIKDTLTIIAAHSPDIFIISGIASAAKLVKECEARLIETLKEYEYEKMSTGNKEILFFKYF